jgi:hypothetical protein
MIPFFSRFERIWDEPKEVVMPSIGIGKERG